jgi:DNA-binding MarR family transcriptional regulator
MSKPVFWLKRTYIIMRNAFDEELSEYNLSTAQFEILGYLYHSEGMEQKRLQQCSGVTAATLTGLLDKLENRGFVKRISDYQDGRAKIVIMTPEGDAFFSQLIGIMHQFEDRMLAGFSGAERALQTDWLQRIAKNLGDSGRDGC